MSGIFKLVISFCGTTRHCIPVVRTQITKCHISDKSVTIRFFWEDSVEISSSKQGASSCAIENPGYQWFQEARTYACYLKRYFLKIEKCYHHYSNCSNNNTTDGYHTTKPMARRPREGSLTLHRNRSNKNGCNGWLSTYDPVDAPRTLECSTKHQQPGDVQYNLQTPPWLIDLVAT